MKTKNSFLLPALIAVLNLIPAGRVTAQTFTVLHSFTATSLPFGGGNSDGVYPSAGLILSGNTLYGTAAEGGSSGSGTVFAVNTDGTDFTNLHTFTAAPYGTNSDGAYPPGLILSGNTLYGTAREGGSAGNGTVFALNTNGTGFTTLHGFTAGSGFYPYITNSDGSQPVAGLILSGSSHSLYGTASYGGSAGNGTVFALNTNGTGFTTLHGFTAWSWNSTGHFTNSDGSEPGAGLILSGNTLYGTAAVGGSGGRGTVFRVNTDGAGFTNLHSFTAGSDSYPTVTNGDGATPSAGLILAGTTLYGTAYTGGSSGNGTVFAVNTDGSGFTILHSFTGGDDGSGPRAGLLLSGNTLYGTAYSGGSSGSGTVFAVNTDGSGFTILHSFTATSAYPYFSNSDGASPLAGLILSANTLYGTASGGGTSGKGTVFSLSFRPQLTITLAGTNIILTWPTNVAGFDYTGYTLQSAPVVSGTFTNLPAATSPYTNAISGPNKFFRLSQ